MIIKTLGHVRLVADGRTIPLGETKIAALAAYLSVRGSASRDELCSVLWSNQYRTQASQNLRQAIRRLREIVGVEAILASGSELAFQSGVVASDVAEFDALSRSDTVDCLQAALALHERPFCEFVKVPGAAWNDWVAGQRQSHQRALVDVLSRLAADALSRRAYAQALDFASAAGRLSPDDEISARHLILALSGLNRRGDALRTYRRLEETMRSDGRSPSRSLAMLLDRAIEGDAHDEMGENLRLAQVRPRRPPNRPSLAVLPFMNLSGDASSDHLALGMADDVITALSRIPWLFVIAASSSFTYRNGGHDVRAIAGELGVRYLVEGGFRLMNNRLRLTVRMVEADTNAHVWADQYEGNFDEIFTLQTEIAAKIASAIEPNLDAIEIARSLQKATADLDAYDLFRRAQSLLLVLTEESCKAAEGLLRQAIGLDPNYSHALTALTECLTRLWLNGWVKIEDVPAIKAESVAMAERAVAADPRNGMARATAAYALACHMHRFEEGLEAAEQALHLQPNSAHVRSLCASVHLHCGESAPAVEHYAIAMRLNPVDPRRYLMYTGTAIAHFYAQQFDEAVFWCRRSEYQHANWAGTLRYQAASLAHANRVEEAKEVVRTILVVQPNSSIERSRMNSFKHQWMYELYIEGLRSAGLPEH